MFQPSHRDRRRSVFVFLPAILLISVSNAAPRPPSPGRGDRIRHIYVLRREIFDSSLKTENKWLYRQVNRWHASTKESAIRGQLLFAPGDIYHADIAKETERALRRILRLRDVHVRPVPIGKGTVDVVVETHDTWSTEPFIGISGSGSESKYIVGLRERNLGGYGKDVGFRYKKESHLVTRGFSYSDPSLLGTRLRLAGDYADTAEGSSRSLSVEKPFTSSLTPFGFKALGSYSKSDSIIYENNKETNRFDREEREMGGGASVSVGSTVRTVRRLGLNYSFRHQTLFETKKSSGSVRDDVYHLVGPSLDWQKVAFVTEDHIRLYSREEDFNMGPSLTGKAGLSQSRWFRGAANAAFLEGQASQGHLWEPGHFALGTVKGNARYEKGWHDAHQRFDLEYYHRVRPWSTLACHVAWEQVNNPDPGTQLILGGNTGLRGYPVNQFSGNRILSANIENRLFFVDDVLKLFGFGAVGFLDTGFAWPRGTAPVAGDLRASYGAGLRFHLTRASLGQVLRFDIAWPTRSANGNRSPVFTFGTGQVF